MKNRNFSLLLLALAGALVSGSAQSTYEPYTFTTPAGGGSNGSADPTKTAARFWFPTGIALDGDGGLYIGDQLTSTVRKVTPAGIITTLAGQAGTFGSVDGPASGSQLNNPWGVAVDSAGNVYVADAGNNTIRIVTPQGIVSTLAGLAGAAGSEEGTGTAARFNFPLGVAVDSAGNVYVADNANNTIRKVTSAGVVTTLAGLAEFDGNGNSLGGSADGTGPDARFNAPQGVALDSAGNLYVADNGNNAIRKVTPGGAVTTLAGDPSILDGDGNPLGGFANGKGRAARFNHPHYVAVDSSDNLYVPDENGLIRKVTATGEVTTLAGLVGAFGNVDGLGSAARFEALQGAAVDREGNVYVTDLGNSTIRKMTPAGMVTTVAGLGGLPGSTDGSGSAAHFRGPSSVAVDANGNIYVADQANHTIRKITASGEVSTLAGLAGRSGSADGTGAVARFNSPNSVGVDSTGNVYVTDTLNHTLRKVTPAGKVTTLAGFEGSGGIMDGTGTDAQLGYVSGLAVDTQGNIYLTALASTIRKVTPAGVVTTLAGLARTDGSADGTGSDARFNDPNGLAVDTDGNVYVADTSNHTIRKMTAQGVVTTLAGLAGYAGGVDGTGRQARFWSPFGVAVDSVGNVYVADTFNSTIRKVTPAGIVTTLGGLAGSGGGADGTGSSARFNSPNGVAVDSVGNIYVADFYLNTIRKGSPALLIDSSGPAFGFIGGKFGFNLLGSVRQSVVIEASTDLLSWLPIWTNGLAGTFSFRDPENGNYPHRAYRARVP